MERLSLPPDKEGFAGPFAGVSNGALIVAGGANFPDKEPWDGGKTVWADAVFVLEKLDGKWSVGGKLPRPLGYGVSMSHRGGVVCIGGSDADRHHADAFRLDWKDGKLVSAKLPPLPMPLANGCGALVGDTLYVAGGQEKPDSTKTSKAVWRLDLSANEPTRRRRRLPGRGGPGRASRLRRAGCSLRHDGGEVGRRRRTARPAGDGPGRAVGPVVGRAERRSAARRPLPGGVGLPA